MERRCVNRTRNLLRAAVLLAAALIGASTGARAGDRDADRESEYWLHDVAALAAGNSYFKIDRGPWTPTSDSVNDVENPLFGGEGEEAVRAFGTTEDLLELVKASLPHGVFEAEDVLSYVVGQREIVIRAPRDVQEVVAGFLGELTREGLTAVTYDVVALTGDPAAASGEGGLAAAISSKALVPLASARSSGFLGQEVTGRQGGASAFLQDHDVEVAEESASADPIVGVQPDGIAFQASASAASAARVRFRVSAWWAAPGLHGAEKTVGGDLIEIESVEGRSVAAEVEARPGAWTLLPATGPVVFAVRAAVRACDVKTSAEGPPIPAGSWSFPGASTQRHYGMLDLFSKVENKAGRPAVLLGSNFTLPEPPELAEPMPALLFGEETIRQFVEPPDGTHDDASYKVRGETLLVRADETRQQRVEKLLEAFRARYLHGVRLRATVVSLPLASLPEYWTGLDDGTTLLADGGTALLARPGAKVINRAGLREMSGQRFASVGGVERSYVGDYDVEIAQKSAIGNPILRSVFEGVSVDARSMPLPGGTGAWCEARVDLSSLRGMRKVRTRHGEIECPSLGYLRFRGGTVLPYGSTRLLVCNVEGKDATLVLLTANPD